MIPPCLTLSNIRYLSRVKWSNPGKGVAPSPTSWCSSYWIRSLLVALDYGRQLYLNTKIDRGAFSVTVITIRNGIGDHNSNHFLLTLTKSDLHTHCRKVGWIYPYKNWIIITDILNVPRIIHINPCLHNIIFNSYHE